MATSLNIRGFVAPEQEFKGLEKIGDTLAAQKAAKAKQDELDKANKKALDASLESYVQVKDYLTGTVNDPYITKEVYRIMQKGSDLAKVKGMDWSMLKSALIPEVSNLMQSVEKIKEVKRGVDKNMELLKGTKGIDENKVRDSAFLKAFYNKDENGQYVLKNTTDISSIDPTYNYVDDVLKNEDVYNPEGFIEFAKTQKPTEYRIKEDVRDKSGKLISREFDVKAPQLYTPEKTSAGAFTQEFVPKHELFTDKDVVKIHQFKGDKGDVNAPIRVVTDDVYQTVMSDPQSAAYIRQQTRRFANQFGVPLASSQAEYFSKALVYDELNKNKPETTLKEYKAEKQPLPPSTTVNIGGQAPYNPIWDKFEPVAINLTTKPWVKKNGKKVPSAFAPVNKFPGDVQLALIEAYKMVTGNEKASPSDFLVQKNNFGEWAMYTVEDNIIQYPEVGTISKDQLNTIGAQGYRERARVYEEEPKMAGFIKPKGKKVTDKKLLEQLKKSSQ